MSADENTRAERAAAAGKGLMVALIASNMAPGIAAQERLTKAEAEYLAALCGLIAPVFRVVDGGLARQDDGRPTGERPLCLECKRHFVCGKINCPHWAAAIRKAIDEAPETFETCTQCDQPRDPQMVCPAADCPHRPPEDIVA